MGVAPNYVAKLVGHSIKTMERHYENIQLKNLEPELVEVRKKKLEEADFQTYDLELGWSSDLEVIDESPLERPIESSARSMVIDLGVVSSSGGIWPYWYLVFSQPIGDEKSWRIFFMRNGFDISFGWTHFCCLMEPKKIHPQDADGHEEHVYKGSET